jgi:hypothetical protein
MNSRFFKYIGVYIQTTYHAILSLLFIFNSRTMLKKKGYENTHSSKLVKYLWIAKFDLGLLN